jgi:hypothetical protein
MSDIQVEVVLQNNDGMADDEVINTLAYTASSVTSLNVTPILTSFYNEVWSGAAQAISWYLSACLNYTSAVCQFRYYDVTSHLDGSPHGGPFHVDYWTLGGPGTNNDLPNQVCVVSSFYDALDAEGTTKGDHRGRIYFGPLNNGAKAEDSNGNPVPSAQFLTDLKLACAGLYMNMGANDTPWSVWSRKDAVMRPVIGGWILNQFDVQRRRRFKGTAKTSWT